ncbi:PREDICTED: LIM domain-containing protein A-like [Myotis brandtii]|uniref:LIM domain-containing protein A-like n=1 Tax=Myotis brandtii TaxID=109478 RepID=UPI0007041426|nr:PREDICTED: LIM domain-containing protein A-like [Myotis brandtii]
MDGVQGAESPPQVVPGHDWHIPRSQEMLCTAPAVIKYCCPPAASQGITHRPLTLQPLTYLPVCHIHSHAPSWKHPTHPQTHFPYTHTHSPTFAMHPHYIFTHSNRHIPKPAPHPHPQSTNLPARVLSQHIHPQIHTQAPSPTKIHPHRHPHTYPSRPRTLPIPHAFTLPPKQTISYKTVRTVPLLRTIISSAPSRVSSMYYTINICGMINKNPHIIYLYPQDPPNLQKPPNTQNSHMLTSRSHSSTHILHNTHSHSPTCTCLQHKSTFKIHQCLTHINIKHTPTHISTCQLQIQHNTHTTYSSYMTSVLTKPNSKHTKF